MNKDNKFDLHEYFRGRAVEELPSMREYAKQELLFKNDTPDTSLIRSTSIQMDLRPDLVKEQYDIAMNSLSHSLTSIKGMGYEIDVKGLEWFSMADSDWNIFHNKGFYILKFSFTKKVNEAIYS